ncbi:pentatricopeptide repeat-containing protein At5g27270-like [Zingiber officinale]|uniref:pentatricopeptide repeat-containing protein At5g27270-like n=1 Tax=Zingiber officinale TaxID=94328 RepID=UPI001C4B0D87|nr:pentatricopeptide repeat-containing protein At5g27270-like [Zingiber officinale]
MECLRNPFLFPLPPPQNPISPPPATIKRRPRFLELTPPVRSSISSDPWSLSDGNSRKIRTLPYRRHLRKPLSDDDARRIIHAKAQYLSRLRRNQGSGAQTPRWIRRTPEQMAQLIEDDRDGNLYGRHVVAAIRKVRALAQLSDGSYNMREVMGSFVTKLSFKEMCTVLKEQRGWRQARDFFAWMKLQLCYRPSVIVYTIVLRIYGQVGKIKLAEQIFLEMLEVGCEPDAVACGTMLCTYARWGRHKDMMLFYSAVRRRDILPSIAVFNFMVSSLQKQKLHEKVIRLWKQMLDDAIEPNRFTYTIVIASYVKEEQLEDALDIFQKMKKAGFVPEEATHGLLISLSAKNGKGDMALQIYEEMKLLKIVPSNYTLASLLTLHYKTADYSKALDLFSEMQRNKVLLDEAIYGILIRIYGKLGLYEDALKTFEDVEKISAPSDEKTYVAMAHVHLNFGEYEKARKVIELMKSRDVELSKFSYSVLLRGYVFLEDVVSAEVTFQMLSKTELPDAVCCSDLLRLYVKLGLLEKAKSLVSHLRQSEIQFDEGLYKAILEVYCKDGMIDEAESLVEEMEGVGLNIDKTVRTSMMAMYGEVGGIQKAEHLLKKLDEPDFVALSVILCLYLENGDTEKSKNILKSLCLMAAGVSSANQLICKYAREGRIVEAETLYKQISEIGYKPDNSAIASMITLYGRFHQLKQAQEVFASISHSSNSVDAVYNSMIDVYCKSGEITAAIQLYEEMISKGYTQDAVSISILVNTCTKNRKYQEAERIIEYNFTRDVELDTVAYNTFIKAMLEAGKLHSALSIYNRMISSCVPPSLQTYNTMISVYGQKGKLEKAIEMFHTAQGLGLPIDEKAYTNIISYYGKAGRIDEALQLFEKMKEVGIQPGKISYNTMINVYATSGLYSEAKNLFQEMQTAGHFADSLTYLALIRACTESKKYSEAEKTIRRMLEEGITPSSAHFNYLIFGFIKDGFVSEAERVVAEMKLTGLNPDLACCRTMMRTYMDYGLIEEGLSFFETINGFLKPDGFILSAAVHLYEFAGRESEAGDALDTINLCGLLFLRNLRIGSKTQP